MMPPSLPPLVPGTAAMIQQYLVQPWYTATVVRSIIEPFTAVVMSGTPEAGFGKFSHLYGYALKPPKMY